MKNFRKKEKISQMELAEYCDTSPGYISEIEIGRKFPSTEMIEKIAEALRIEPYHLFKDWTEADNDANIKKPCPRLSIGMKKEIKSQIESSINEIFDKY